MYTGACLFLPQCLVYNMPNSLLETQEPIRDVIKAELLQMGAEAILYELSASPHWHMSEPSQDKQRHLAI